MTVSNDFLFIGGDPALDLLNTERMRDGAPADVLDSADALVRWLAGAALASPREARRGVEAHRGSLGAVKRLRSAIRELAIALGDGQTPKRAAVAAIDAALRSGRGSLGFRVADGGFKVAFELSAETPADPQFLVARAAASFFAQADRSRIRRCEGPGCILFFYDATKSRTRRWCSMAGCGGRVKAAAHYRRARAARE